MSNFQGLAMHLLLNFHIIIGLPIHQQLVIVHDFSLPPPPTGQTFWLNMNIEYDHADKMTLFKWGH